MNTASSAIVAENLNKTYARGNETVVAVNNVSLEIKTGEFVAFVGPSGSGKTTLINILGCLDNPTSGSLTVGGRPVFGADKPLSEKILTKIRRELFGYVFQKFYLIPTLTVLENIILPFAFYKKEDVMENVDRLLKQLGLENRKNHLPGQISGGEMQRTAIARALVNNPRILLADEPTGNLDTARGEEIGRIMAGLNQKQGLTVVLVTHNRKLADSADRLIELRDGRLSA